MQRFERMVTAQGGSLTATRKLGASRPVAAKESGFLSSIDGQLLGQAMIAMGGGRKVAGERIDFAVGIKMHRKIGDALSAGQPILDILCDDETKFQTARTLVESAITISETAPTLVPLWRDFLGN